MSPLEALQFPFFEPCVQHEAASAGTEVATIMQKSSVPVWRSQWWTETVTVSSFSQSASMKGRVSSAAAIACAAGEEVANMERNGVRQLSSAPAALAPSELLVGTTQQLRRSALDGAPLVGQLQMCHISEEITTPSSKEAECTTPNVCA